MKILIVPLILLLFISCNPNKEVSKPIVANPFYDLAWAFLDSNQSDSSFIYFNKAKERAVNDHDSIIAAKSLINMSIISGNRGDYFGSQEISISAIAYLNPNNDEQKELLSSNYNNLGKMAHLLKNYQEADQFYHKALALTNKKRSKEIYLNNIGINLSNYGKYREALQYFDKIKRLDSISYDPKAYARVLSNIAKTKWMLNPAYKPMPDLMKALAIREREEDLLGQNASLGHLVDYYYTSKPDSALFYSKKKYKIAEQLKVPDGQLSSLKVLIKLSSEQESRCYFEIFEHLEDSIQTDRNAAKNQFAVIRYETEKSKADNLVLQKDNSEKKYQITRQKAFLIGSIVLTVALAVIAVLWYKKRKQKLQLEAQSAIRDGKLKTSKKVHDVVANGLYQVMTEIENQDEIDKEGILDRIEVLYEKSRDISYEDQVAQEANFKETINGLLMSYGAKGRRVSLVGNKEELWDQVAPNVKHELTHVLQELMVNMSKHSQAANVVIKFEQVGNEVNIYYTDDGVGINGEVNFKNGLNSTGNRIASIGGDITFETKTERGLKVRISFPIT